MRSNYMACLTPQLRILSDDRIEAIHLSTLEILEGTGVLLGEPEALELLDGAGAYLVGKDRVKIPSCLVEEALRTVPKRIVFSNRAGDRVMFLEDHKFYYGPNSDAPDYLDPFTRARRACTVKDAAAVATVCDYLPNMDFILEAGIPSDADPRCVGPAVFKQLVTHTEKVIGVCLAGSAKILRVVLDMAAVVAGGYDNLRRNCFLWWYAEPISPLHHCVEGVEKLLICAQESIPLVYTPMPMAGSSAPASMAGVLAQLNAEVLSGLVIHQLKNKGAPFIYGGIPSMMDMKTTVVSYGAPEMDLMSAAMTDMAHYYKLPVFSTAGCSDAKDIDQQFAVEATLSCLMTALSGANLIHDVGLMDAATVISPEAVVLVDEILGMVKRIMGGVPVDEETLAIDVIREVGPAGHYLDHEHTLRHFKEMWYPRLFDRTRYKVWSTGSRLSLAEKINEKTKKILETHKAPLLPNDVLKELDALEEKWKKEKGPMS